MISSAPGNDHAEPTHDATVEDYEPFIGQQAVDRIVAKGRQLAGRSVAHVNSTYFGGGVAEMLSSLTLLMRSLGLDAEWRAIQGPPDFFSITKKMHNALQGAPIRLTDIKKEIYEEVAFQNAMRNRFDHDFVVVHDPQPLPLVRVLAQARAVDLAVPHRHRQPEP